MVCECHAQIIKVPEDGTKCEKPCHAENHVVAVKPDGVTVNDEELVADPEGHIPRKAVAGNAVTIGDRDMGATAILELESGAVCSRRTDEVVGGARVDQCRELLVAHADTDLHRVLSADACDRREGDQRSVGVVRGLVRRSSHSSCWCGGGVVRLLDDIICRFKVEEPRTLVVANIGPITIIAKPLLASGGHLIWREPLEGPRWSRRRRGR
jgi:hypothetical protein